MIKYYISEKSKKMEFTAANKARDDVDSVFKKMNYIELDTYMNIVNSNISSIQLIKEIIIKSIFIKRNSYVYIQYPYYKNNKKIYTFLKFIKKIKRVKIVALIHDIDSIRFKEMIDKKKEEIQRLNRFDFIISHNESMSNWLIKNGVNKPTYNIDIFDYLLNFKKLEDKNIRKTDIAFAGNLDENKSGFIYKLMDNNCKFTMNLYGPNFNTKIVNNNIKYKGQFLPEELISKLEGKFGLIWDGDSTEECSGISGQYTKYNNPHKLSMYIAAGLPIICWENMAISKFVRNNKVGICISNLNDINEVIYSIKDEQYSDMVNNVLEIRERVIDGKYTAIALENIE